MEDAFENDNYDLHNIVLGPSSAVLRNTLGVVQSACFQMTN